MIIRFRAVTIAGVVALASVLSARTSIPQAAAAGLAADEIQRRPVVYHGSGDCAAIQNTCSLLIKRTPADAKRRLEIAGISCIARVSSGEVYRIVVEGAVAPTPIIYDYLRPEGTGERSGFDYYVARSEMRYVARAKDETRAHLSATGDIDQFVCTLQGTMIRYK